MNGKNPDKRQERLSDRVALITGGTSGIGKATAILFAAEGAIVVITGRRAELGKAVVAEIKQKGGKARYIHADHVKPHDCQHVIDIVIRQHHRLDILFNNAGTVMSGTAEGTTAADWNYTMELNVTAVWRMSKLAMPHMRAHGGGVIINNASDWGLVGAERAVAYCTSKGAVIQLTRAMALDHARDGVRIIALCPGDTYVERWQKGYLNPAPKTNDLKETLRELGEALPLGRVGQAEEIAKAVLFLASDDSSFMTGATLVLDGGNTAR